MQCDQDNAERTFEVKEVSEKWDFCLALFWLLWAVHWKFWLNIVAIVLPSSLHLSEKNDDSTLITDERTLGGREKLKISTKCVESVELFNFSCAPIEWMNGVLCASCAPMCDVKRLASDSFDNLHKSLISLTPDTFSKHDPIFKTLLTHYWRHRSCIVCAFYWAPRGFYSSPPRLLIIIKLLKMVKNENEFPRRFMFILRFRYCWALSIISSPWRTKRLICCLFSKRARFGAYTMTSSSYSLRKAHYAR